VSRSRAVSTAQIIAAERQTLFDLVADPRVHPVIDGSGSLRSVHPGDEPRLALGATFGAEVSQGVTYRVQNRVVEFEEGRRIAWCHVHGHRWRYEFEDAEGGTRVVETFDWSTARSRLGIELLGFPRRNLRNMRATLERLDELATTGRVSARE